MSDVQVTVHGERDILEFGLVSGEQVIQLLYTDGNMGDEDRREMMERADKYQAIIVDHNMYRGMERDLKVAVHALEDLIEEIELRDRIATSSAAEIVERLSDEWGI